MMGRATFRSFQESTAQDWKVIAGEFQSFSKGLADRVLHHLSLLRGDFGGFPIDRLDHSLQTATRALRDGRNEAYVCRALLYGRINVGYARLQIGSDLHLIGAVNGLGAGISWA